MRQAFAEYLLRAMREDDRIWVLTADLGYKMFDSIREEFPARFVNVGAAEQMLIGAAVGLSYQGKIPFCYSITPFLLCRPYEWLRNYLNHEGANVKLVGSGRDNDYEHDGFTHYAGDDLAILKSLPEIRCFWPGSEGDVRACVGAMLSYHGPDYLNLRR